ncbi:hypothetical protein LTR84_004541 [Exophiala bonariae]|uniref:Uncharacterized protein n=1 Tax=Exophiala bonariae TaxID=1690606 RepID=A0AAV9NMC7_9EURO|nr:hypothetical protein LTR84_004541 [Exophiala bonariae]
MSTIVSPQHEVTQPLSRLLELPGELRNRIVRYVVTQPYPIALRQDQEEAPFTIDVRILYTCKQLRDEASSFLHDENIFEIEVDSHGSVTSLHFTKYHSICEYRAQEVVSEVSALFLDRFSHFQFRLLDTRSPDSLRKAIQRIAYSLNNKHITVIPPRRNPTRRATAALATRVRDYPQIDSPLSPFSTLRCASFSVLDHNGSVADADFGTLIDLVTSGRPPICMAQKYNDVERSARAVDKMLILPGDLLQDFGKLRTVLFKHLRELCQCANKSDQDTFMIACERFESCYRQIQELQ